MSASQQATSSGPAARYRHATVPRGPDCASLHLRESALASSHGTNSIRPGRVPAASAVTVPSLPSAHWVPDASQSVSTIVPCQVLEANTVIGGLPAASTILSQRGDLGGMQSARVGCVGDGLAGGLPCHASPTSGFAWPAAENRSSAGSGASAAS